MMLWKTVSAVIVLCLLALPAGAESLFVSAKVCPLFQEALASSKRLGALSQGTELQVVEKNGAWIKVKIAASGQEGFVQALFTGSSPSVQRSDTSSDIKNMSTIVARKRASAYTTSAAATRGLTTDNVRERENLAFKNYDFSAIKWLDTFVYTDEEIMDFARQEGLAP